MPLHTLPASSEITLPSTAEVGRVLLRQKYCLVRPSGFDVPTGFQRDWRAFQQSWENLPQDRYLPDGGRYRLRRYSRFLLDQSTLSLALLPHRLYFQSAELNQAAGGIQREFEPLEPQVAEGPVLRGLIALDARILKEIDRRTRWQVDVHQIRTTASREHSGKVVPEGVHQDGLTFISTRLVDRRHVTGGVSSFYSLDRKLVAEFTLTEPLDVVYALDEEVMHDASSIAVDGLHPEGHRDTLLFGFSPFRDPA